jgi:hypothetical protein
MIRKNSDEHDMHEPMTMCISHVHQMQVVHERDPLNSINNENMSTEVRKPPIGSNGIQDTA